MKNDLKKAIVTTTINKPTKALYKFIEIAKRDNWVVYIVGDLKTPHDDYLDLERAHPKHVVYITPNVQQDAFPRLSNLIGWNCIQRRNFGFIWAYRDGSEIIATVDDDNIPYDSWGKFLAIGNKPQIAVYESNHIFDPLQATNHPELWHRGFPIQLLRGRAAKYVGDFPREEILVQADLWNGEPDVDAVCRIAKGPFDVTIERADPGRKTTAYFAGLKPGPFNSQNTFLHRDAFPYYFLFPHIGRMDDIWASYYLQAAFPDSVVYGDATVYQERNEHDLSKDLEAEVIGYRKTLSLVNNLYSYSEEGIDEAIKEFLPADSWLAFVEYREAFSQ